MSAHGARAMRTTRRLANLSQNRPGWYRITNAGQAGPALVSIYDEIGFVGVSAADFMAELRGIGTQDIELHLNSPGGDVFDGIAIYNTLRQHQRGGQVHVIIDGLAASAASFIAQAASPGRLEISPHAQMMIHNGFAMAIGDAADLRETADLLDKVTREIAGIYADRTGKPADHWLAMMAKETWLTDAEAVAEGLADGIHGQGSPSAAWDLSVYAAAPGTKTLAEQHGHPGQECWDPDGDGDCDLTAAADTDHDYWAPDGRQLKAVPGKPMDAALLTGVHAAIAPAGSCPQCGTAGPAGRVAARPGAASIDTSPWDAAKAWHGGATADDPAAFYKGICAGRKAGDPATQDAWALPYRYTPSSAPNAAGVRAALSRLPQTQGLTNAAEARALLERLMHQVNPDYEPGDLAEPGLLAAVLTSALEGGR